MRKVKEKGREDVYIYVMGERERGGESNGGTEREREVKRECERKREKE